jgi:hypothetical protein
MAPPVETLRSITGIMRRFVHPEIVRYLAWVDGAPAGAAGSTYSGRRARASLALRTVPAFRRRGAQAARGRRRLARSTRGVPIWRLRRRSPAASRSGRSSASAFRCSTRARYWCVRDADETAGLKCKTRPTLTWCRSDSAP